MAASLVLLLVQAAAATLLTPPPTCAVEPVAAPGRLAEPVAALLAAGAVEYRRQRRGHSAVETLRAVRYREAPERNALAPRRAGMLPEFRFLDEQRRRPRRRAGGGRTRGFPSGDDWAVLFHERQQSWFLLREKGVRLAGFDLVREVEFRGGLPFTDGRDIREWEGTALTDAVSGALIEVRAQPRNQHARLQARFERWTRSWKITFGIFAGPFFIPGVGFRLARAPLAYHALVRFDAQRGDARLPTLVAYEVRKAVAPDRTVPRRLLTRRYEHRSARPLY